jgi:hypothetical protein
MCLFLVSPKSEKPKSENWKPKSEKPKRENLIQEQNRKFYYSKK